MTLANPGIGAVTLLPHLVTTQPLGWGDRSGHSAVRAVSKRVW
jgi:hypothetical protein